MEVDRLARAGPAAGLSLSLKELNKSDDSSSGSEETLQSSALDIITRAIEAENAHHLREYDNVRL